MALVNPCNLQVNSKNTGTQCSDSMKATSVLILVPKGTIILASQLLDFTQTVITKSHAAKALRWYPIFGTSAPVMSITESKETDVIETMDDGSQHFVRYGMYNRTFLTTDGGLCLAQALMSFNGNAYGFIEVDITGQVSMMSNGDGTFSPFPVNLGYAPTPDLATLKTVYKNAFMLSFSPTYYIKKGTIFSSDTTEDLVDAMGLVDTQVVPGVTASTTTNIYVSVETICADDDLITQFGTTLGVAANFIIALAVSPFTVVTPSAALIIAASGANPAQLKLTGTYVSGSSYTVSLVSAATLLAANVEGYEGIVSATVAIP